MAMEMHTLQDKRIAIAALRVIMRWPKGARKAEAIAKVVELWAMSSDQSLEEGLSAAWATLGNALRSVQALSERVLPDSPPALRVLKHLEEWAIAGVPADVLEQGASFREDVLQSCGMVSEVAVATLHAQKLDDMSRLGAWNRLRATAYADATGLVRAGAQEGANAESPAYFEQPGGAVAGGPEAACSTLNVWFGTDRARLDDGDSGRAHFGGARGADEVTYGVSAVSIPRVHLEGAIERPAPFWKFWRDDTEYLAEHIVIRSVDCRTRDDWVGQARSQDREGLIFIHGFNVTFDEAMWRTAQMAYDLRFPGLVMCFSWASVGKPSNYMTDEATIDWSAKHLEEFLGVVCGQLNLDCVHIIAHSMGNRALLSVLENWSGLGCAISQVVLAAPDVDAGRFRQIGGRVFGRFEQVTLYASRADKAIALSKDVRGMARAGDADPPLVLKDLSTIDVTRTGASMFSLAHSYLADVSKVFRDLYYIINARMKPNRRAGLRFVPSNGHYELE